MFDELFSIQEGDDDVVDNNNNNINYFKLAYERETRVPLQNTIYQSYIMGKGVYIKHPLK